MPLNDGEIFAGFTIVRLLGSGGMGEVYLVQHPRLPRRNALKVLPIDVSADPEYRARFNREADLASTLWHPHIVSVHDRGEYNGQLWISMDYIDGQDAARLLADRYPAGMPIEQVVRIVTSVASALDYAHKQGLLHRDVKPANIMLSHRDDDDEQRILLADFGIARDIDEISGLTTTNMAVGSVAYAAPEQLMGEEIDGRADQYALAATAYHLLTGAQLFPHSNPAVVISRHLNADPPAVARTRPELAALDLVLAAALAKNPDQRFARCSDFARALADQVSPTSLASPIAPTASAPLPLTETATTKKPPHVEPDDDADAVNAPLAPSGKSRNVWLIAGAAGAVAVLVIGTVILFSRTSGQGSRDAAVTTSTVASTAAATPSTSSPPLTTRVTPPPPSTPRDIAGQIVMLDPGFSGGDDSSGRQVPNGRGGTADCQTSGASTDDGYPEHTFAWDTTLRIRQALTALGVRTAMTRGNDTSPGPCVDERAAMANALHPNAIVSIHADGGPPTGSGFHINYSSPPLNQVQAWPSVRFAQVMRDQLQASGLVPSTYVGTGGLDGRSDLTGLNLAQYPSVLVELGNMNNPEDAALMTTPDGRQKYAEAVVRGIAGYLSAERP